MTYEEYHEIIKELYCLNGDWIGDAENLEVEWVTGGRYGGNWRGDSPDTPLHPEPPLDIDLDALFERLCPNLTYLKYRKLEKVIENDTREDREYYGNYTTYGIRRVNYRKLYDFLVLENVITND
jgi:hypothetical protein